MVIARRGVRVMNNYTINELMAVTASRMLKDGQNVVVGLGLPQVATLLAKNSHDIRFSENLSETGLPNDEEIYLLRNVIDPKKLYI